MKANEFLREYLVGSDFFTPEEFASLSESTQTQSIKEVAITILNAVKDKVESFDTTPIDRSRGDIKQLREINALQQAITQLETMIERSQEMVSPELQRYLKETVKTILYLNQYSLQFKEAYRDRKTLLILKYQSMIMSVFSSVSYLISVMIDFSSGDLQLKAKPEFEEIAPLRTIMEFNRMVEKGDFRLVLKNVTAMREYFVELDLDKMALLESTEIIGAVIDGLKGIIGNGDKFVEFLYKAAGVITLVFSLREIFYTMFRARTKFQDIVGSVEGFANAPTAGAGLLAKLNNFAGRFVVDAQESSKLARREIEAEDRGIMTDIRMIPKRSLQSEPSQSSFDPNELDF